MREPDSRSGGMRQLESGTLQSGAGGPVSLRLAPPRAKLHVQSWNTAGLAQAALQLALQGVTGVPWPAVVGATAGTKTRVLCYGPVDWLVVADEAAAALLTKFEDAMRGSTFTGTDQSQGLAAIEVMGPRARDLLSKGCCLDFHLSAFPAGACARTRLAHVPVIVDVAAGDTNVACYVARSYRDYLYHWLTDASIEFEETCA